MNLLALDTSTESMSIAVQRHRVAAPWQLTAPGGAQSSTQLIPQLLALLAQAGLTLAQLDAVVFGAGPGSFTGLRTACSVAQGLAFGANLPVLPVDTLLAVAEEARGQRVALGELNQSGELAVTALLDARMDELYTAGYHYSAGVWRQTAPCRLIKPEALVWNGTDVLAGNVFAAYGARLPGGGSATAAAPGASQLAEGWPPEVAPARRVVALPTATAMLRLAPALLAAGAGVPAEQALPTYIRDKVAQTTQERAALKAALTPASA